MPRSVTSNRLLAEIARDANGDEVLFCFLAISLFSAQAQTPADAGWPQEIDAAGSHFTI